MQASKKVHQGESFFTIKVNFQSIISLLISTEVPKRNRQEVVEAEEEHQAIQIHQAIQAVIKTFPIYHQRTSQYLRAHQLHLQMYRQHRMQQIVR